MHFNQLEAFVQVVKLRSFSRAAEEIYLSQPTISSHISSLEKELGIKLIIRSTKEVYPSWAGKILFSYATEILNMRDKAVMALKNCSGDVRGTLDIAASTVPSQYLLPELLPHISREYPNLFYSIKQYDSREVVSHVLNMDAEIGIVGTALERSKCIYEPFTEDRLVVVTPNTPKYRALGEVFPLEQLCQEPFLMREYGSGTRKEMEDALSRLGVNPKALHTVAQMDSTETIKQAVAKGLGISILSRLAAEDYSKFGMLLQFDLNTPGLVRKFYFVYHRDRPLSPSAEAFICFARQFYQDKAAQAE